MRTYLIAALIVSSTWLNLARANPTIKQENPLDKIELKSIDAKSVHLGDASFAGKVLLIVNTASQCGYTPQYEGLENLYKKYANRGFAVLGFPSNDFGAQEPGSNAEIKSFCSNKFKVDFPMFSKAAVKGAAAQPLYQALIAAGADKSDVAWNFEKFLLDRNHKVVARFKSAVAPESKELLDALDAVLGKV